MSALYLHPETQRVLRLISARFFLISSDGTVKRLNACGKAIDWCFKRKATALHHAHRTHGTRVWDSEKEQFVGT
jgi:hypothetical protein